MIDILGQLINGIQVGWWLFFALVLLSLAIALMLTADDEGDQGSLGRHTTPAGNPTRKRGWGP